MAQLPKPNPRHSTGPNIQVSPLLLDAAAADGEAVLRKLDTGPAGLTEEEAARRLAQHGPNAVAQEQRHARLRILVRAMLNPLVILLLALALISLLTGDLRSALVMATMVVLGVSLRFVQEARADSAAARLKAMIRVTATVLRDGQPREVPLAELVPGDVVQLAAGDMIPADLRLLSCKDLFVIQSSLTGESFPVEKMEARQEKTGDGPLDLKNVCYLGTSVESGSARGVLVCTGRSTYLGSMASAIVEDQPETSFDRGIRGYTWLMIRFIMVMVPLVFFINGLTKGDMFELTDAAVDSLQTAGVPATVLAKLESLKESEFEQEKLVDQLRTILDDSERSSWQDAILTETRKNHWWQAFLFAIAVAVGLTPEMLPMIVSVCLSKDALLMSRKRVIVKQLNSIQNLGAMDVLCTDKTGTLTMDRIILEQHCNVGMEEEDDVLLMAYLNSHFQTGLKNLLDRAILDHEELKGRVPLPGYEKFDEIPFDFSRKVMSVVVQTPEKKHRLIAKGAPEEIFRRCTQFDLDGKINPMEQMIIKDLETEYEELSTKGFRVLALAYRDFEPKPAYGQDDERDLILRGYVAFLDPPKDSAGKALTALKSHGIAVKVLTGDNELVSRKVCHEVGIETERVLLGKDVEKMTDGDLAQAAEKCALFARLSPGHKQRIIKALQSRGHVVGFLGDGINDAPALRAADVGISVDTAVDIAKESADAILLEKSLMVLEEGVVEGRKVFANILKYVRMGASSNFGNMFSVLGASIMLPFMPMAPIQVLTNNLLYDFSQVPIPTDDVDPESVALAATLVDAAADARFILCIGPCSSVFDYTTFFMMLYVFDCWSPAKASLFQTGWFVESLLTQTLIIHIIRTNRIPLLQSRASWPLIVTTVIVMAVGMWLPFSPLGPALGFTTLPPLYWPLLLLTLAGYVGLTVVVKGWLYRRGWVG